MAIYTRSGMRRGDGSDSAWFALLATLCLSGGVRAEDKREGGPDDSATVGAKLQNPISELVSLPLQSNFEFGIGPRNEAAYVLNLQPVIPFPLGKDWKLISRSILPVMDQPNLSSGGAHKFGLGDWTQSF